MKLLKICYIFLYHRVSISTWTPRFTAQKIFCLTTRIHLIHLNFGAERPQPASMSFDFCYYEQTTQLRIALIQVLSFYKFNQLYKCFHVRFQSFLMAEQPCITASGESSAGASAVPGCFVVRWLRRSFRPRRCSTQVVTSKELRSTFFEHLPTSATNTFTSQKVNLYIYRRIIKYE